jgi:hypothetical protein
MRRLESLQFNNIKYVNIGLIYIKIYHILKIRFQSKSSLTFMCSVIRTELNKIY